MKKMRALLNILCYIGIFVITKLGLTLGYVVFYLIYMICNKIDFSYSMTMFGKNYNNFSLVINIIDIFIALFVYNIIIKKREASNLFSYCNFNRLTFNKGITCAVLGITFNIIICALISCVYLLKTNAVLDYIKSQSTLSYGSNFIMILISICIITPVFEEILFRGIIQKELKNKSVFLTIIFQALLFGIYHLNIIQGIYTFIFGILLGLVYYIFKSIFAPIIMHIAFNCTNLFINEAVKIYGLDKYQYLIIGVSAFLFIVCLYIIFYNMKSNQVLYHVKTKQETQ